MIKELEELYKNWYSKQIILKDYNDFIEITTPFVDMHHDYIQLYFFKNQDGKFVISDDGYIISELTILGIDLNSAKKRKKYFENTLRVFGVNYDEQTDELYVTLDSIDEYPKKQHNLIQCITRVSDMLLTARNAVASIFFDEVFNYFEENEVIYIKNPGFIGKSGNQQTFDFVIPRTKKKREKLIQTVNTPTSDNYVVTLFSFIDVQDVKAEADFVVIANDTNVPIDEKFSSSLTSYDVEILAWSKRDNWINELKVI